MGSETSQISAVAYINKIDHFIKEDLGIKAYGRYMDDSYIIHHNKDELKSILERLTEYFNEYGITLNKKKTQIRKLSQGFTFLKTRFYISDTGKIIKKPCRDSITRERKKLKAQARLHEKGLLDMKTIEQSFQSWKGSMQFRNARKSVFEMSKLYNTLFKVKENEDERKRI